MKALHRWKRSAAVLAAAAPLAFAATTASAATPLRTANTTDYTTARFLQDTLGLPNSADHAIEPVTYDHFQWLLQQPGDFAILIGDPALDASFAARAQDVEATAKANGVERVYWFDPNLSGSVRVGNVDEPALDIRNATAISQIDPLGQAVYRNAWLNLVGRYLGNGVALTPSGGDYGSETSVVTGTTRASTVNDSGATLGASTKVGDGDGGALYDYTAVDVDPDATDSYFLVYDKDKTVSGNAQRIVSWTNLTEQADSTSARADVDTAIDAVGGANLDELSQFDWWKDEVNFRNEEQGSAASGKDVHVLTDADAADGWEIEQITYPQLVHLLESDARRDAVILFGGTWCPNTRPVLPAINRYAQQNDVHVFNFDTVLDGATVGGSATSAANPLQIRNTASWTRRVSGVSTTTTRYTPSFLYGDLISQYLPNLKTQYVPSATPVTYNPAAGTGADEVRINKLQVPYLVGYKGSTGSAPHDGVTRQWIIDKGDGTYTEYMTSWGYANPQPNQIGISRIPLDAPIWATINAQLTSFSWQTDPATLYPNSVVVSDADQYLVAADTATVGVNGSGTATVSAGGPTDVSPAALSAALAALGAAAPTNYNEARAAYVTALAATPRDDALIGRLTTVVGSWGLLQQRKTLVINAWGEAGRPASIAGAAAAVRALEIFFGGLPGGVVSTQTVTANPVKAGTAPTISVAIANDYGRTPTGNVSLVVKKGGATVATGAAAVANGAASFTLPALGEGAYDYTVSYATDDQILGFDKSGTLTVTAADAVLPPPVDTTPKPPVDTTPKPPLENKPAPTVKKVKAKSLKGAVATAPTSTKGGTFKVTIAAPKGGPAATGKVTITLKKGKTTKKITGTLKKGVVTVKLPKLAKGTWKAAIAWPGDSRYLSAKATATIKVKK